jgi:hypothetical protein
MINPNLRCPKGHSRLNFIDGLTAIYCELCDRLYAYGQLQNLK